MSRVGKQELRVGSKMKLMGSATDPNRIVGKGGTHSKVQTKLFKLDELL